MIDLTQINILLLIIPIVISICAIISPIAVALINNRHNRQMKLAEFQHLEKMEKMELNQKSFDQQFNIFYQDKKTSYSDFLEAAGAFNMNRQSQRSYDTLQSSANKTLLFCNTSTIIVLEDFMQYVNQIFGSGYPIEERKNYTEKLNTLAEMLTNELESIKLTME